MYKYIITTHSKFMDFHGETKSYFQVNDKTWCEISAHSNRYVYLEPSEVNVIEWVPPVHMHQTELLKVASRQPDLRHWCE